MLVGRMGTTYRAIQSVNLTIHLLVIGAVMRNNGGRLPAERSSKRRQTRSRVRLAALIGLTLLGLVLCVLIAYPFLPALAWALALAVMAFPIHTWLEKHIPSVNWNSQPVAAGSSNWAAGISTAIVIAVIVIPLLLVAEQLGRETAQAATKAEVFARDGRIEETVAKIPHGQQALTWLKQHVDVETEARRMLAQIPGSATIIARGSAWFAVQALVCIFVLFFAFRDWRHLLITVKDISPLSKTESEYLFTRIADSIHATVYATLATSIIQGVTGGLLFWALGLPAPVLWGVVMTVLGIIPLVGAFLVWIPAAVVLALDDQWGAAAILTTWGLLMAGPVGNWLYANLAGDRMRLHPVPVLLSFVGGLAVFGVSGMVLGPVVLVVTMGLLEVWRRRFGSPPIAEEPAKEGTVVGPYSANAT